MLALDDPAHAAQVVEQIARGLAPSDPVDPLDPSLSHGGVGRVLWFSYLDDQFPGRGFDDQADTYLEALLERLAETEVPIDECPGLFRGFLGSAWLLRHLGTRFRPIDESATSAADEVILHYLSAVPSTGRYDVVGGLVGIGVYALEGPSTPTQREILDLVLAHLARLAVHDARGVSWRQGTPEWEPDGRSNLGMAHGLPGVIAFLGMVCGRDRGAPHLRVLLEGAVRYLLAQQRPDGQFPAREGDETPARLAWCYGEASNAWALLVAARALGSRALDDSAIAIARRAAGRSLPDSRVRDAGICHGAAGLTHVFNCLQHVSGHPELHAAARAWRRRTLEMHVPETGIGGYRSYQQRRWHDDGGYLTGAVGTGLVLLATLSTTPPGWDAPLLLSALRTSWAPL
jgi:lantibiotic biosynthesis protein